MSFANEIRPVSMGVEKFDTPIGCPFLSKDAVTVRFFDSTKKLSTQNDSLVVITSVSLSLALNWNAAPNRSVKQRSFSFNIFFFRQSPKVDFEKVTVPLRSHAPMAVASMVAFDRMINRTK